MIRIKFLVARDPRENCWAFQRCYLLLGNLWDRIEERHWGRGIGRATVLTHLMIGTPWGWLVISR